MSYPIKYPLPGQTQPLPLIIDGTCDDGTQQGDGANAPWFVFDQNNQCNVAGPFRFRFHARLAANAFALKHGLEVAP